MVVLSVDITEKQGMTALHPAYLHQKSLKSKDFRLFSLLFQGNCLKKQNAPHVCAPCRFITSRLFLTVALRCVRQHMDFFRLV